MLLEHFSLQHRDPLGAEEKRSLLQQGADVRAQRDTLRHIVASRRALTAPEMALHG